MSNHTWVVATTSNHSAIGIIKSLHFVISASNRLCYQMLQIYSPFSSAELITILKLILIFFVYILTLLLYMNGSTTIYGNVFHILIIYMHGNLFRASFCNSLFFAQSCFLNWHSIGSFSPLCSIPQCEHTSIYFSLFYWGMFITNNTVVNILGYIPLGSRLTALEDIHQEAIVRSGYIALTLLDIPTLQQGCANSHLHQQQRKVLIPHLPQLIDTWYSQVFKFLSSRWVVSCHCFHLYFMIMNEVKYYS